ncbi:MAG TPA: M48 family metalloprotease [Candidatus Paceibacterota bacterium]|nr:M48 family metalloprotease [Candidatus Paceibacterota bacterium]
MATLYTEQSKNIRKTWLLVGVFLSIVLGLGYFLSVYYNNPSILVFAFIFSLAMNIASFWFSDKIALASARAIPADEKEFLELHRIVENLSITAGLLKPRVYIIPDMSPNAFATGRNKEHSAVAVTTGLLQILDRNELEGVIAHELAHIGNRDILLQSMVVVLVGFISLISNMFLHSLSFRGGGDDRRGSNVLAIVGVVLLVLSPIFAQLIQLAISRKREFLADATGALLTRYPEGLASALRKIHSAGIPMQNASDATAHLYISNPFGGRLNGFHKLFMTHPPVEDRINALVNSK